MARDPAVQEMEDRAGMRDVMVRYARGLDRRDFTLVTSCFTSEAHTEYGTRTYTGLEEIVQGLRRSVTRFQSSTHFMGDQLIERHGDAAEVETYAIDYLLYMVDGTQYRSMGGLRYHDTMVRQDGRWQISHRVMYTDWRRNERVDTSAPGPEHVPYLDS